MSKNSFNQKKETEEIKWLKTQRNIAILGLIATIFATSVQYIGILYKYISKSSMTVQIEDEYVKKEGQIKIIKHGSANTIIIAGHPNELPEKISLDKGSYQLELSLKEKKLFQTSFYLKAWEGKVVKIHLPFDGTIFVFAELQSSRVFPEMPLPIKIESSRKGYLWIYGIEKGSEFPPMLYPDGHRENEISPDTGLILPNPKVKGIKAGPQSGDEKLLFVVTEKQDKSFADQLALTVTKSSIQKAANITTDIKYGLWTISYKIEGY